MFVAYRVRWRFVSGRYVNVVEKQRLFAHDISRGRVPCYRARGRPVGRLYRVGAFFLTKVVRARYLTGTGTVPCYRARGRWAGFIVFSGLFDIVSGALFYIFFFCCPATYPIYLFPYPSIGCQYMNIGPHHYWPASSAGPLPRRVTDEVARDLAPVVSAVISPA